MNAMRKQTSSMISYHTALNSNYIFLSLFFFIVNIVFRKTAPAISIEKPTYRIHTIHRFIHFHRIMVVAEVFFQQEKNYFFSIIRKIYDFSAQNQVYNVPLMVQWFLYAQYFSWLLSSSFLLN